MAADKKGGVFGWTVLTAINCGKVLTACCLALCVFQHGGLHNMRQVVYIGVHGAYLLYWMVHQYAVPEWEPFADPATPPIIILALAVIGVGYALPAWLAFGNPHDIAPWYAVLCIFTSVLGGTLNAGSDWYKAGAKAAGAGLVTTGPYTYSMRPNYFADWIRYLSFAMVTGRPLALLLPGFVILTNVATMPQHIKSSRERYGNAFVQYASRVPAIVPGLGPAIPKSEAVGSSKKNG